MKRHLANIAFMSVALGLALASYLVSARVSAERTAVEGLKGAIAADMEDMAGLEAELRLRARLPQLEAWNREVLALQPPRPGQVARDPLHLAAMVRPPAAAGADQAGPAVPATPGGPAAPVLPAEPDGPAPLVVASLAAERATRPASAAGGLLVTGPAVTLAPQPAPRGAAMLPRADAVPARPTMMAAAVLPAAAPAPAAVTLAKAGPAPALSAGPALAPAPVSDLSAAIAAELERVAAPAEPLGQ
jgi:hypothetical protein